ncbi:EAL domain-containing protein [Deinococcus sp. Arct2-2]|uniref:EAL domain-containing protein n=1 Tax=Deinococcus sp. Arct2-2 TaxID=2568653 RepID=UPI001454BDB2|nr:EAL domain-containing protein [Deinococcus sp. Arct2-2]
MGQARALRGVDDVRAILLFEQVVVLARRQPTPAALADALNSLAGLEHARGDSSGALLHLEEALAVREAAQDDEGAAVVLCNLGVVYLDLGNFNTALEHLLRAQATSVQTTPSRAAVVAGNLARTYDALNMSQEALVYSTQALHLTQDAGLVTAEAAVSINHADLLRRHGDFAQAGTLLERALELVEGCGIRAASALQGLGQLRRDEGRLPEALSAFQAALHLAEKEQDLDVILETRCGVAQTLLQLERPQDALGLLKAALTDALSTGRARTYVRALKLQAQAIEQHGDLKAALTLWQQAHAAETDVLQAEAEKRTRELTARGELEKARAKLEQEQARYEVERDAKEKQAREQATRLKELERLALYDALTALPNRLLLAERVCAALKTAAQQGEQVMLGVLDLNKFKEVNDTHGHHTGDLLLQQVAQRLIGAVEPGHTVARTGGDEFVVLMPGVNDRNTHEVARRLLEAFDDRFYLDGIELSMRPSMGLACYPQDASDLAGLLERADQAMYRAKARGSGFEFGGTSVGLAPATLEAALHGALRAGELHLEYQPLEDDCGQWVAVEALLRWRSSIYGNVTPDQFLPLAERSGLSRALGEWTLRQACTELARWPSLMVAVNVSARQLADPGLPDQVRRALHEAGIVPARLALEVREEEVARAPERSHRALAELRAIGVQLTLDDFGGGHAHFAGLAQLPVHAVKLDRALIHGMDAGARELALVQAVTNLARALDLTVIAKGVETSTQRTHLQEMGVRRLQGFLVAPPLSVDALHRHMNAQIVNTPSTLQICDSA